MSFGCIQPRYGISLLTPAIQRVANFAVEDHNEKMKKNLRLVGVEKAAYQFGLGRIYYLTVNVKDDEDIDNDNGNHKLFRTAVLDSSWQNFIESTGLEYICEAHQVYSPSSSCEAPSPPLPIDLEIKSLAEFAVDNHNKKLETQLRLVHVLSSSQFKANGYFKYSVTLVVQDHLGKHMICTTKVTKSAPNNSTGTESRGLKYICSVPPSILVDIAPLAPPLLDSQVPPDWISQELLSKVKKLELQLHAKLDVPVKESNRSLSQDTMATIDKTKQPLGRISRSALELGEERTRNELIPFLSENNDEGEKTMNALVPYLRKYNYPDDDDVLLIAMAEELGEFIPYVGGVEHAKVLLPPLEALCTLVEDPFVRLKAIMSLRQIGEQMKENDFYDSFIPLVKRLAVGESFRDRVSSCGLIHIAYDRAPKSLKPELMSLYSQLCRDDMLVVRKYAALSSSNIVCTFEHSDMKTDIMPILEYLAQDDEVSIRLSVVRCCALLPKLLDPQDCVAHLLPLIVRLSQDKIWQIRFMVANQLYELCEVVGPKLTRSNLVPAYVHLLRDNEVEVRSVAVGEVTKFCMILEPILVIQHILPCVKELSSDSSGNIRLAVASSVVMGVAPLLEKDAASKQLLPIILSLLKDDDTDVRLNIISKLDQLNQVIGIDLLSRSLLDAIFELAEHRSWVVRLALIEHIPLIASQLGAKFLDDYRFAVVCTKWLEDEVASVRAAAIKNLNCVAVYGAKATPSAGIEQ